MGQAHPGIQKAERGSQLPPERERYPHHSHRPFFHMGGQLKDYYAILGVRRDASSREIKKAYRRMVKKWHPDLHPQDPSCRTKILEINEAYEVLSAPEKRQAYDRQLARRSIAEDRGAGLHSAHHEHPFFSYFLRVNEAFRRRTEKS